MALRSSWTDTDLRRAVTVATSWRDTAQLDHAHFRKPDGRPRPPVPRVVSGTPAERRDRARGPYRTWDLSHVDR